MATAATTGLIGRMLEEVMNQGRLEVIEELYTPDTVSQVPGAPPIQGRAGTRQLLLAYRTAFPDVHIITEDRFAVGDREVTRYTFAGTHQGELQGIAPTGKAVSVPGIVIGRIAGGKLAESWFVWDTLGLLQQVGAMPTLTLASV